MIIFGKNNAMSNHNRLLKPILAALMLLGCGALHAQVPFYAAAPGDGVLFGYHSLKFRPANGYNESFTTFQYGIGKTAVGLELYTCPTGVYSGYTFRAGFYKSNYFNIGFQTSPTFSMSDHHKFSYITSGLYVHGAFEPTGRFYWLSNTLWTVHADKMADIEHWLYLGAKFPLSNGSLIHPMVGTIHSWRFDSNPDLALGCSWAVGHYEFFLWSSNYFRDAVRVVFGIAFVY